MTQERQTEPNEVLKALVQNYGFKRTSYSKIPTINYVYPDFTADGNTEAFRFSSVLRGELGDRDYVVRRALEGREIAWTIDEDILLSVDKISSRLGIDDLVSGNINSVYAYSPILFLGFSESDIESYLVKPIVDHSMAWFEFSSAEKEEVRLMIESKAREKPYRTFFERFFGGRR